METLLRTSLRNQNLVKRRGFTSIAESRGACHRGLYSNLQCGDGVLLRSLRTRSGSIVQVREVSPKGGKMQVAEPNVLDLRSPRELLRLSLTTVVDQ